jgi:hypothetical protein
MRKPNNRYVKELVYKLMAYAPRTVMLGAFHRFI